MQAGLCSQAALVIRRSQIVLARARSEKGIDSANPLGCKDETVRKGITGFPQSGIAVLKEGSRRPDTPHAAFSSEKVAHLKELVHPSPRNFRKASRVWPVGWAAEVSYENGWVAERISAATTFAFGLATDPNGTLVITEDPSAGARSGRGTMWTVPYIP